MKTKIVLDEHKVIQALLAQPVVSLCVNALKHGPIVLTPRSATRLTQYPHCHPLKIRTLTTIIFPPTICEKEITISKTQSSFYKILIVKRQHIYNFIDFRLLPSRKVFLDILQITEERILPSAFL